MEHQVGQIRDPVGCGRFANNANCEVVLSAVSSEGVNDRGCVGPRFVQSSGHRDRHDGGVAIFRDLVVGSGVVILAYAGNNVGA